MTTDAKSNYQGVWDNRLGFGEKPALIVIDFVKAYTEEAAPLFAEGVREAVARAPEVLEVARKSGLLILHTQVRYTPPDFADAGLWLKKAPVLKSLVEGNEFAVFCDEVLPLDNEIVITKQYASAFHGTHLAATLTAAGIDTLIMVGCTTSGCIRATAVDALQNGFRPIVIGECVGDRHDDPHNANLFDIDAKYGDVVSKQDVFDYLGNL